MEKANSMGNQAFLARENFETAKDSAFPTLRSTQISWDPEKMQILIQTFGVGPKSLHGSQAAGDVDAAGPWTTL